MTLTRCENLAANLVKFDTERGFRLLDSLLRQPYDRGSWLPVGEVQSHNAQFWNMLHQVNAERALRAVFTAILEDAPNSYRVDLNEIVNQESDAELLIALAHESEEQAILVCKCLNFEQPSCWRIATGVLWKYPDNPQLLRALMRSIMHFGFVTLGPGNEYEMRLSKVEQMLADSLTSPVLLPLLMLAESELRATTRRESSWFMDKDINGWSDKEDNPASPERLWAIRELVHAGKDSQIQRLLSKDELQRILPDLGLLQQEENRLNKLIEQWDQI